MLIQAGSYKPKMHHHSSFSKENLSKIGVFGALSHAQECMLRVPKFLLYAPIFCLGNLHSLVLSENVEY